MPYVVISIDFELRWGVLDRVGDDPSAYRRNLEGSRDVVPLLLQLFASRGVRATWAVVGAIACSSWDEWEALAPTQPAYRDARLRFRSSYRDADRAGRLYFAPELVEAVHRTEGQDLGSHTFSHVYFREPGFEEEDAVADARAMASLFRERWGSPPATFVFPRNQVAFTDVLRNHGIRTWRENPRPFYWKERSGDGQRSPTLRALRFADSLAPLGTRKQPRDGKCSSYFVRFGLPEALWRLHRRRIADDVRSLGPDEQIHLWWHPHNLGAAPRESVGRVRELLNVLQDAATGNLEFVSMVDLASAESRAPYQ